MGRMSGIIKGAAILAAGVWLVGTAARGASAQEAKALYEKSCSNCHGPGGKGDGPASKMLKPPAADFATALKGKADADIAKTIKEGGKAVGKSPLMPAFGAKLTDEQIQGLVGYVKGFASK
jgi:cytochrome c oxidase cbb3-type subunit 3